MTACRTRTERLVIAMMLALPCVLPLQAAERACPADTRPTTSVMRELTGTWTKKVLVGHITSGKYSRKVQGKRIPLAPVSITRKGGSFVMTLDANGIPIEVPIKRATGNWAFEADEQEAIDAGDLGTLLGCDPNTLFRLQGQTRVAASGTTADISVYLYYTAGVLTGVIRSVTPRHAVRQNVTLSR